MRLVPALKGVGANPVYRVFSCSPPSAVSARRKHPRGTAGCERRERHVQVGDNLPGSSGCRPAKPARTPVGAMGSTHSERLVEVFPEILYVFNANA